MSTTENTHYSTYSKDTEKLYLNFMLGAEAASEKIVFHARHRRPPRRPRNCRHQRQRPRPRAHDSVVHLAVHGIAVLLAHDFAHDRLARGNSYNDDTLRRG